MQKIILFGAGNLATRLNKLLKQKGCDINYISNDIFDKKSIQGSAFTDVQNLLDNVNLSEVSMVYIVDDLDNRNLEFLLAVISKEKKTPITISLFNENVSPHLKAAYDTITIINPAKTASEEFVNALYTEIKHELKYVPPKFEKVASFRSFDKLLWKIGISFLFIIIASTVFFHYEENLSWIDSLYFVIVTVATVGYGDISLAHSSNISKCFGIILMLTSTIFIWTMFSLIIDQLLKQRVELSLGRKKYNIKDHVIVCGLGRVGYFIAEKLIDKGEKVLIIESNNNSPYIEYFRHRGAQFFVADARVPKVLQDAGVVNAKALISAINDDALNLEIGLNARSLQPGMRLVLRIFDSTIAEEIREHLDIHLTLSTSEIAVHEFFKKI